MNNKELNKGFYACAVWRNGDYQKGATRYFYDDDDFLNTVDNAWSGCRWFVGNTEAEVDKKAYSFMYD